jgi:NAD(P)-dependent dehydrogenase (short-subunit alcohol dehydrogenase family)
LNEDIKQLFDLTGKVAIITGGGRGIGEALALIYAKAGASVVVASRSNEELEQVVAKIEQGGGKALAIPTDAGNYADLKNLADKTVAHFGGIDILVNNAGMGHALQPLLDIEDDLIEDILQVNLLGYIKLAKYCVPHMRQRKGGKIINISSIAGIRPGFRLGFYSITKTAVIALTQVLASELGRDNIQVNAIAPGVIRTKMATGLTENEQISTVIVKRTPAKRLGETKDLIGTGLFLASSASDFVTGELIAVDGGIIVPGL